MNEVEQAKSDEAVRLYKKLGGNTAEVARIMGIARSTAWNMLSKAGMLLKPLAGGTIEGTKEIPLVLPKGNKIFRYICSSAQCSTYLNEKVWKNIIALKEYYKAELLISTYTYNKNAYGQLAVKRGTLKASDKEKEPWYDPRITDYICDKRKVLGDGLVFCGEVNILPTASNPLAGFDVYTQKHSSIFPHAKLAMRSVATMKGGNGAKLLYTTGTLTLRNYIQRRAGFLGEFNHCYSAILVEVNSNGEWWVRQLNADKDGAIQDLDIIAQDGEITTGNTIEAITHGDIHASMIDPVVKNATIGKGGIVDTLKPRYQFFHDIMSGESTNPHGINDPHSKYRAFVRGYSSVQNELDTTAKVLKEYHRDWCQEIVVSSNHDSPWIYRWLKTDYRTDSLNARLFLELQLEVYKSIENNDEKFNLIECAMRRCRDCPKSLKFLREDESFLICNRSIECGAHGDLGPNGVRGTPNNLKNIGKKCNVGHYHSACIVDGLYAAGTSANLNMVYNRGPQAWSASHILTYSNSKRCVITIFNGKWKA